MNQKQKEELGKYLLDISKFIFAGVFLIKLLDTNSIEKIIVLASGLFATLGFLFVGIKLLKN
ncbi:MAG: ABC transporter permease [Bacteroidetes bacterium]|nr:MAG: ABC transporter permease [Bacteroidota bacterium]